jgi:hypothetical protein
VKQATSKVDASRAYAFTTNPAYLSAYHNIKADPLLHQLGYDAIG